MISVERKKFNIDQGVNTGAGGRQVWPFDDTKGGTGELKFLVRPKWKAEDILYSLWSSLEGNSNEFTVADPSTVSLHHTFSSPRRNVYV